MMPDRRRFMLGALATVGVAMPFAAHAEESATLMILVFPDGHIEVRGQRLDDAGLERVARAHVTAVGRERARATIAADRSVVYSRMIAVMDALHRGGIEAISMAVAPNGP